MTEPYLRIGPFSRASSLSIKSLRAYHEQGLLVPAEVDPDTGYRVYAATQLLDATVLRRLRDLDVPLRQVREVLEARNPSVTERVLAEHAQVMQQRLDDTLRIIDELQRGVDVPSIHTPIHLRDESATHALMLDGNIADISMFAPFMAEAFTVLLDVIERSGAERSGADGLLCPPQIDDEIGEVTAYVPIATPVEPGVVGVRLGEIPASRVAVAAHLGSFDDIDDTYRHLGRWVATNASPRDLPVRERYLVPPPASDADLRTEIHWPVEATA